MSLNFTNPRTFANGKAADLTKDNINERYGSGYQVGNPLGHWGANGPIGVPEVNLATLNAKIADGSLSEGSKSVLALAGHDGAALTRDDLRDLYFLKLAGSTYLAAIAVEEGWRERTESGSVDPFNPPAPPVDPEHQASAAMPDGWKKMIAYGVETFLTECHKGVLAAVDEGVLDSQEASVFTAIRLKNGLALWEQVKALPEDLVPGEPAPNPEMKGQAECDVIWDHINAVRLQIARRKMHGYETDPFWWREDDQTFFNSNMDRHFTDALRAMSNVAISLGLLGKKVSYTLFGYPREARDFAYVVGMYSWASQDPVARQLVGVGGGSGLAIGGARS